MSLQERLRHKEGEVKRLVEEVRGVKGEKERADLEKDRVAKELGEWRAEAEKSRGSWESSVQMIQSFHRIVLLRTNVKLEAERSARVKQLEAVRKEKVERMRAEFEAEKLKGEKLELEVRVEEVEEVLQGVGERYKEEMVSMIQRVEELEEERDRLENEVARVEEEKKEIEARIIHYHAVQSLITRRPNLTRSYNTLSLNLIRDNRKNYPSSRKQRNLVTETSKRPNSSLKVPDRLTASSSASTPI